MADWNLHDKLTVDPQDTDMLLVEQSDETAKATTVERFRNWLMETAVFSTLTTTVKNIIGAINEHDVEIGDIDVENDGDIAAQLNAKVNKSNIDITYYVNASTGDDNNDGLTSSTAFKTIQHAIDILPKFLLNKITINVSDGIYERLSVKGFSGNGTININGEIKALSTTKKVKGIDIEGVNCILNIQGLYVISDSDVYDITVDCSQRVNLSYMNMIEANTMGCIQVYFSNVYINYSTISNKKTALETWVLGNIMSTNNAGSGNTIGLQAHYGGNICKQGTQPNGTTAEAILYGGVIR